jgi:hypothetical protein
MFNAKKLLSSTLQSLPPELSQRLESFSILPRENQLELRDEVLLTVAYPSAQTRVLAVGIAASIALMIPAKNGQLQKEIAGALAGGHLGYYSIEVINHFIGDVYTATVIEESLVAALGGLIGTMSIDTVATGVSNLSDRVLAIDEETSQKLSATGANTLPFQVYNIYVLLTSIIPIALRIGLSKHFNDLYPLTASNV